MGNPSSATVPQGAGLSAEFADRLLRELFGIGLDLAGCANQIGRPVSRRLEQVIDRLDVVTREVRLAILDQPPDARCAVPELGVPAAIVHDPRCAAPGAAQTPSVR
jgi:hypothetical protein